MSTTINIEGHHIEVTPSLEAYVESKLSKSAKIFINKTTTMHVILTVEKLIQKAEVEMKIAGDQNSIFAEASSDDLYKSIDMLEHKLHAQVKKYHDKLKDHDQHK